MTVLAKRIFFSLLLCPICCCQRYLTVEDAVVIGELNEYHLIPTPVFSSFKPPSAQTEEKF